MKFPSPPLKFWTQFWGESEEGESQGEQLWVYSDYFHHIVMDAFLNANNFKIQTFESQIPSQKKLSPRLAHISSRIPLSNLCFSSYFFPITTWWQAHWSQVTIVPATTNPLMWRYEPLDVTIGFRSSNAVTFYTATVKEQHVVLSSSVQPGVQSRYLPQGERIQYLFLIWIYYFFDPTPFIQPPFKYNWERDVVGGKGHQEWDLNPLQMPPKMLIAGKSVYIKCK